MTSRKSQPSDLTGPGETALPPRDRDHRPHAAYYRSGVPSPPVQGAPYSGVYVGDARNLFTNC
jgi:hypothetical protein